MNDVDKNLSDILETEYVEVDEEVEYSTDIIPAKEVTGEIVPHEEHLPVPVKENQTDLDIDYDYELSREKHHELIDKGSDALDGILKVAKESQHPRAYEVAAAMLKNVSDMTDKLIGLQERKKQLKGGSKELQPSQGIKVENAVFVGSTSELLKQVRREQK